MSKSDLKARPAFHRKRDSIGAHLTIVFAALAIARHIERITSMSIGKFIKTLEPIRNGIVSIEGISYPAKPNITSEVASLIETLNAVRFGH